MMQPKCGKCRTKAMMAAAKSLGVNSVELQGENKNQMVVIGDRVDAAALTSSVRKKVKNASLEIVQQLILLEPLGGEYHLVTEVLRLHYNVMVTAVILSSLFEFLLGITSMIARALLRGRIAVVSEASDVVFVPGDPEITWQIVVGTIAGITPFVVAGIEFSKRIVAQKKCTECRGSGLVLIEKEYIRCPNCGGFLPWQSWQRFFSG
ncbi:hypothetical protein Tco_0737903 [Tanacetum coccineum]